MGPDDFAPEQGPEKPKRDMPGDPPYIITGVPDPDIAYDYGADAIGDYDLPRKRKHEDRAPRGNGCSRCSIWLLIGCLTLGCLCCILPFCLFITVAGGMAAIASNSEATITDTQTLEVEAGRPVTLTVDNPVGSVVIEPGASGVVAVETKRRAFGWNQDRAQRELQNIAVSVTQPETNDIRVEVTTNRDENTIWSNANNVEMTIRVPERVSLTIKNNLGSITVRDVPVDALDLHTTLGSIVFEGTLSGDSAGPYQIETSTGSIIARLPANVYAAIDARADVGSVTVGGGFALMTDVTERSDAGENSWTGTLGGGDGDPPTLTLRSNTGAITIETR